MKVYICSSLRPEVYAHVTDLLKRLPKAIHMRPYATDASQKLAHVETDVAMIKHCDEVWVVGEYGRDCSWEIGYAAGIGKPVTVWEDYTNAKHISDDWMLHHAVTAGTARIAKVPPKGTYLAGL